MTLVERLRGSVHITDARTLCSAAADEIERQFPKELAQRLMENVRGNNVCSTYRGGKFIHHGCELCGSEWGAGAPETHNGTCLIAMADIAIEQMP